MKRRLLRIMMSITVSASVGTAGDPISARIAGADTIEPSSWSLYIEATAGGVYDSLARMGVRPDATTEYDPQYEIPRPPPPPGSFVMVYFPHDSGNWPTLLGTKYAVDYTTPGAPQWRFSVETNVGAGPVTLGWDTSVINQLPDSYSIILRDSSADSSFTMRGRNSYTFPYTVPRTFRVHVELASTFLQISRGWNLVSAPRIMEDYSAVTLFPSKISAAYEFDDAYLQRDTLRSGTGYWVKFPGEGLATMTGLGIDSVNVPVHAGWNLIGSVSRPVPVPTSENLASPFYEYSGGYRRADSILPGGGYWIKVFDDGTLSIGASTPVSPAAGVDARHPTGTPAGTPSDGTLTITDGEGGEIVLGILSRTEDTRSDPYALPPPPPEMCFDARFSNGGRAVIVGPATGTGIEVALVVQSPGGRLGFHGIPGDPQLVFTLKTGPDQWKAISGTSEPVAITCGPGRNIFLLRISPAEVHPSRFELEGNYPNPFNPTTTIRYRLPEDAVVSFTVRDVRGRRVFTREGRYETAGPREVSFDAASSLLGSGIYFYTISAVGMTNGRTFLRSGKMTYLK